MRCLISAELIITCASGMCEDAYLLEQLTGTEYQIDPDIRASIDTVEARDSPLSHDAHGLRVIHADATLTVTADFDADPKDIAVTLLTEDMTYYSNDGKLYSNAYISKTDVITHDN